MSFLSKPLFKYVARYIFVLLFLTLSLILAACGGDSGNAATNSVSNEAPQVTAGVTNSSIPSPATTTATDNDTTCGIPNFQAKFIALVNGARAKGAVCGEVTRKSSKPLVWNDLLSLASLVHLSDMAFNNFFYHNSPRTDTLRERIRGTGFNMRKQGKTWRVAKPVSPKWSTIGCKAPAIAPIS